MTRVIPPQQTSRPSQAPAWFDAQKVVAAANAEVQLKQQTMQKTASEAPAAVVASYGCVKCHKTWGVDHPALAKQATLAVNAGTTPAYVCPDCGSKIEPYSSVERLTSDQEIRSGDEFVTSKDIQHTASGTYNTFVDRHIPYKALNALENFAVKQGMTQARARYLRSEHTRIAGQQYPTLNAIDAVIEWRFGKNQKLNVTAKVEIQPDGNFKLPKVFTTSDGKVVAFEKDVIKEFEKSADYRHEPQMPHRKSDQPIYKRQDPSNFRAMASQQDGSTDALVASLADETLKKKVTADVAPLPGAAPPLPGQPNTATNPSPVVAPAGAPPNPPKAGDKVTNPADGKSYTVQAVTPGSGATVLNPENNQTLQVPENQVPGLRPELKTTALTRVSTSELVDQLIRQGANFVGFHS